MYLVGVDFKKQTKKKKIQTKKQQQQNDKSHGILCLICFFPILYEDEPVTYM